jgi:hypothetical protein
MKEYGSSGYPSVGVFHDFVQHTEFNGKEAIVVEGMWM